jgi:rSAM/selenodomain-associated transferase 1
MTEIVWQKFVSYSHKIMPNERALLVVAKQPYPGHTKTRLCPPLTHAQAADLYDCFLRDTLDIMRQIPDVECLIGYLPEGAQDYFRQLAPDMSLIQQCGSSLGERLDYLSTEVLSNGWQQAVLMDSDSPTLPVDFVIQAFKQLTGADVVLGPTRDGGYYLIGMKLPQPQLLRKVQMSTPHVLTDTLRLAEATGLTVSLLPAWYDVDNITDLYHLIQEINELDTLKRAPATRLWLAETDWRDRRV